jgi:hypothetical protein
MAASRRRLTISTLLGVGPYLSSGSRGPAPKLGLLKIFNYILQLLYLDFQWKEVAIDKDGKGRPEIRYTRIYRAFRRWEADGCMDATFAGSVLKLHEDKCLSPWQSQCITAVAPSLAPNHAHRPSGGYGP